MLSTTSLMVWLLVCWPQTVNSVLLSLHYWKQNRVCVLSADYNNGVTFRWKTTRKIHPILPRFWHQNQCLQIIYSWLLWKHVFVSSFRCSIFWQHNTWRQYLYSSSLWRAATWTGYDYVNIDRNNINQNCLTKPHAQIHANMAIEHKWCALQQGDRYLIVHY